MSGDNILTCEGGTVTTGSGGEPLCSGTWELDGNSAFWDLTLTTGDVASIAGSAIFIFALVWCFKVLLRTIFNNR
jgi:hypothetical protein